ncbi:hypothetical protein AC622_18690 [Bacillus sp. FJAT-27916]|uniref:hypothetical protein n=1 Tax=Bacillus sp. FJAT-27916 TaxID=1679169 RepID=UPI000671223B|nr:hypothetical protein [Bacillus sp. FJAT-27916]KMY45976.1 hypothetical protein AC622_18690 [Bacillus sp. FJAT-27916]
MKKIITLLLIFALLLSFAACGSEKTQNDSENTSTASQSEKNTGNDDTDETGENENKISGELDDIISKDVEDTIAALNVEYEKLVKDIDTYKKYLDNTDRMEAFYEKVYEDTKQLGIRMREYSIAYAELILSSDTSNDDKYDEFEKIYDCIYDDAGDEIYDNIYDGILDDIYDNFYAGILDDAYDNAPYDEWSDARSNEYDLWSDTRSDVYDEWSDTRSDVYDFCSDMRGELWDNDIEKAEDEIKDFKEDVEKLKGNR